MNKITIIFLTFIVTCLSVAESVADSKSHNRFILGVGLSTTGVEINDLPNNFSVDEPGVGYLLNGAFYVNNWLSFGFRHARLDDIGLPIIHFIDNAEFVSNGVYIGAEHFFGESNFFVRGKFGLAQWRIDGVVEGYIYLDEELKNYAFEGEATDPYLGVEFGYAINRKVEFSIGYETMSGDSDTVDVDLRGINYCLNIRF